MNPASIASISGEFSGVGLAAQHVALDLQLELRLPQASQIPQQLRPLDGDSRCLQPGVATKWWTVEGAAEGSDSEEGGGKGRPQPGQGAASGLGRGGSNGCAGLGQTVQQ